MSTGRTEAFSDGVIAVAITLLIFNVAPPDVGKGALAHALWKQWPSYASYAVSFLTIGIIWVNHHAIFKYIVDVDRPLLFLNLFLLMCVAFIPFPTALVARYLQAGHDAGTAAALYGVVMTLMSFGFSGVWLYAVHHPRLLSEHLDVERARATAPRFGIGSVVYVLCIALSLVNADLGLALYALVAVYYIFNQIRLPVVPEDTVEEQGAP